MTEQPVCKIINLTSTNPRWMQELILGPNFDDQDVRSVYPWVIETKYYRANIQVDLLPSPDQINMDLSNTEAVIFYCDPVQSDMLSRVDKVWERIKEFGPAVCLMVVDTVEHGEMRTNVMSWCLTNMFELIECDEEGEEDQEIEEKVGRDRIVEALKSHTWSNLELIEEGDSVISEDEDIVGDDEGVDDDVTFDTLFSQLGNMKDKAAGLPDDQRRKYAENVALSFYKAMGGDEEDSK